MIDDDDHGDDGDDDDDDDDVDDVDVLCDAWSIFVAGVVNVIICLLDGPYSETGSKPFAVKWGHSIT